MKKRFIMSEKCFEVLEVINDKLRGSGVKWALTGSCNLALHGLNFSPNDVDITIQSKELNKVKKLFSEYNPSELKYLDDKKIITLNLVINGVDVQFFGGNEEEIYTKQLLTGKIEEKKVKNFSIPCFSLETEALLYEQTGRKQKSELIRKHLKTNPSSI